MEYTDELCLLVYPSVIIKKNKKIFWTKKENNKKNKL